MMTYVGTNEIKGFVSGEITKDQKDWLTEQVNKGYAEMEKMLPVEQSPADESRIKVEKKKLLPEEEAAHIMAEARKKRTDDIKEKLDIKIKDYKEHLQRLTVLRKTKKSLLDEYLSLTNENKDTLKGWTETAQKMEEQYYSYKNINCDTYFQDERKGIFPTVDPTNINSLLNWSDTDTTRCNDPVMSYLKYNP